VLGDGADGELPEPELVDPGELEAAAAPDPGEGEDGVGMAGRVPFCCWADPAAPVPPVFDVVPPVPDP